MLELDRLRKRYRQLQNASDLNEELLLRILLDFVLQVDDKEIDIDNSSFLISEEGFEIQLFATKAKHCTLYLEILNHNIIDIQLKEGGEYLYLQEISDWNDVQKLRGALSDLFTSQIKETLIKTRNKIKKAIYSVNHEINHSPSTQEYSITLGAILPWQKKLTEVNIYEPWIE